MWYFEDKVSINLETLKGKTLKQVLKKLQHIDSEIVKRAFAESKKIK